MQSVPITTKVVWSNPTHADALDATLCDKICQWQVGGFLQMAAIEN
jgi:hypothetical protein